MKRRGATTVAIGGLILLLLILGAYIFLQTQIMQGRESSSELETIRDMAKENLVVLKNATHLIIHNQGEDTVSIDYVVKYINGTNIYTDIPDVDVEPMTTIYIPAPDPYIHGVLTQRGNLFWDDIIGNQLLNLEIPDDLVYIDKSGRLVIKDPTFTISRILERGIVILENPDGVKIIYDVVNKRIMHVGRDTAIYSLDYRVASTPYGIYINGTYIGQPKTATSKELVGEHIYILTRGGNAHVYSSIHGETIYTNVLDIRYIQLDNGSSRYLIYTENGFIQNYIGNKDAYRIKLYILDGAGQLITTKTFYSIHTSLPYTAVFGNDIDIYTYFGVTPQNIITVLPENIPNDPELEVYIKGVGQRAVITSGLSTYNPSIGWNSIYTYSINTNVKFLSMVYTIYTTGADNNYTLTLKIRKGLQTKELYIQHDETALNLNGQIYIDGKLTPSTSILVGITVNMEKERYIVSLTGNNIYEVYVGSLRNTSPSPQQIYMRFETKQLSIVGNVLVIDKTGDDKAYAHVYNGLRVYIAPWEIIPRTDEYAYTEVIHNQNLFGLPAISLDRHTTDKRWIYSIPDTNVSIESGNHGLRAVLNGRVVWIYTPSPDTVPTQFILLHSYLVAISYKLGATVVEVYSYEMPPLNNL